MQKRSRLIPAMILLAAWWFACWGCTPPSLVPRILRPNTIELIGIQVDSAALLQLGAIFNAALPAEGAACLRGAIVFVPRAEADGVEVTDVLPAVEDSADGFHVWFPVMPWHGCPTTDRLVAIAHTHPYEPPSVPCTHSDPDVGVLFTDQRLLVSLVFCGDGRGEALWQDGRRQPFTWATRDSS